MLSTLHHSAAAVNLVVLAGSVLPTAADRLADLEYAATVAAVEASDPDLAGWLASQADDEDDAFGAWLDAHADELAADAADLDRICSGVCPC